MCHSQKSYVMQSWNFASRVKLKSTYFAGGVLKYNYQYVHAHECNMYVLQGAQYGDRVTLVTMAVGLHPLVRVTVVPRHPHSHAGLLENALPSWPA